MENPLPNSDPQFLQTAATINETAAMESLMRTYEKQLQNPIYGMLYGNLMTAMLIQMQKLKGNQKVKKLFIYLPMDWLIIFLLYSVILSSVQYIYKQLL